MIEIKFYSILSGPRKKFNYIHREVRSGPILSCNIRPLHTKRFKIALLYGFIRALFSLQINQIMNVTMMIPTKTIAPTIIHFRGCDPLTLTADDHLHQGNFRLIYEGGATTTANFCCQITTEQVDKIQLAQNMYSCWSKQSVIYIAHLSRASN